MLLLLVSVYAVWPPPPYLPAQARCPVAQCHKQPPVKKKDVTEGQPKYYGSFLQTGETVDEPNVPLPLSLAAERPYNDKVHETDPDSGVSLYNIAFKPGHFMCSKCDMGTCPSCNTVCDLSSCIGEFYQQECWCRKESQVKLKTPEWWFRQYDSRWLLHDTVRRTHCDSECKGGICDMPGLQCQRREDSCRPWWWCGLDPPTEEQREKTDDDWPTGFEYTESFTFLQEAEEHKTEFLQRSSSEEVARRSGAESKSGTSMWQTKRDDPPEPEFEKNDIGLFDFKLGSWECGRGSFPPKVQNPSTFLWDERGYIVFDSPSCKGGEFDQKCFCWDQYEYVQGNDPKTSELHCDSSCGLGPCAGNTCASSPPPPPTAPPPPPPLDPVEAEAARASELKKSNNKMDPLS